MTITYLLGAGASCPAGIPATNGMVKDIYQKLKDTPFVWPKVGEAIDLVIAGIKFNKAIADSNLRIPAHLDTYPEKRRWSRVRISPDPPVSRNPH